LLIAPAHNSAETLSTVFDAGSSEESVVLDDKFSALFGCIVCFKCTVNIAMIADKGMGAGIGEEGERI
jgi:hypothetical protein